MARVTTVVATRNRWTDLVETIPRHQRPVVLVDNGSDDGTPARVREAFPHVRVVELDHNAGAVARNVGVRAAETPYVAFADDDSWWAGGALDRAAACLDAHPRLGLLAATILVGDDERLDPVCREMAHSPLPARPDLPGPPVLGFVACGTVVRREAFLAAGGFDDVVHFGGEEERLALDLASRGWGLSYVDDVVAHHHPSATRDGRAARRTLLARNRLLTALMRRPWPVVCRDARLAGRDGFVQAVPRAAQALRRRAVVPVELEHELRLLEQ
jgi:GT2 family glycosyltransferase